MANPESSWVDQAQAICAANNLMLYDYGQEHYSMPRIPQGGGLFTHMIVVYRMEAGRSKWLAIDVQTGTPAAILNMLQEAIPHFEEQSRFLSEGEIFPFYTRQP